MGGTPPHSLRDNRQKNSKNNGSKRAKISVFWPKMAVFLRIFSLTELGGTPPPLTENHPAQKPLAERGGTPPLLNGKFPKIFLKKWVKKG